MTIRSAITAVGLVLACAPASSPPCAAAVQLGAPASATIDKLLAPIALYPDPLLAQMLLSASSPATIGALHEWMQVNQSLKGSALQDAAVKAGFDASFVALVLFPQVVTTMAEQIDWTTRLGQAFAADRSAVFDSIQRLRRQAKDVGTLKTTPQQAVTSKTTESGQNVIVIESANPQVVYVPQYNPEVVYTQAPTTSTVVIKEEDDDTAEMVAAGLIGFTAGVAMGAAINNSYYYGPYGWHGGGYMYNDAWDDYYDAREDAREDWQDHREDLVEERGDRAENAREQRTDRQQTTQEQRTERSQTRQENRPATQGERPQRSADTQAAATQAQSQRRGSSEARGYSSGEKSQATRERSSGGSDAFSGYSSNRSQRSSSSRGQSSRGSRGGGGRRR
jgi:hypothetical protein